MRLFFLAFALGFMSLYLAQPSLQNNNWMFGATAVGPGVTPAPGPSLNFTNCNPIVENDSPGAQFEGQTAISNSQTGDLLFYSSGSQVRNSQGQIMPGGNLVGTSNSISQNLIVKKPGSSTLYYLFTPETQAGAIISTTNPGLNGFSYSIIDMSLAGGLGAVVSSGNLLQPFQNCEMVTGVYHPNGQDIWIIGHKFGNNTFFAYLLTPSGINPTPVYSNVGPSIVTPGTSNYANSNYDAVGELKASPDGSKLAFTTFYNSYTCLFQFNSTNGVVSNPIPLSLGPNSAGYGTSFSQDNSKLYFSRVDPTQGGVSFLPNGAIIQFDISTYSQAAIQASYYVVYSSPTGFRSLKLGPDGKLYAARTTLTSGGNGASYLAVINNPNQAGPGCNFVNDGIFIGANKGRWGLNNVIEDFYTCNNFNFTLGPNINKCPGASVTLVAPSNQSTYLWNTGATTANLTVIQPGTYWVTVTGPSGSGSDTIVVSNYPTPSVNIIGATGVCPGNTATLLSSPNFATYQWSNGQQTQNINVGPGTYWLTATNSNGCIATDTFTVEQWPNPVMNILGNTFVCAGYTTELSVSTAFTNYQWSNGQQTQNINVGPGTYWLNTTDANGCVANDTVTVVESPNPVISILGNTYVCTGQQVFFEANPGFTSYQWTNGQNTAAVYLGAGTYSLTVTDSLGCQASQEVTVIESSPTAEITSSIAQAYTNGPIQLQSTSTPGLFALTSWYWDFDDGSFSNLENPLYTFAEAGIYSVTMVVTDELGCTDTASYIIEFDPDFVFYIPNSFTPDGDRINQIFLPVFSGGIDAANYQMLIFNRWGEIIFESQDPTIGWDASFSLNGNPCQAGTYTYVVSFKVPSLSEQKTISGHVNLIR
jgi:gliding motility-associated-like protein